MRGKAQSKYRYTWQRGNRFRLLIDGQEFFVAMLGSIESARSYVLMEMYLFESGVVADRFIESLTVAAARNVRVYLLLDDYGALRLLKKDRKRLVAGGVQLVFYNPLRFARWHHNLFRNHRKLLLVDGRLAYTGGAGITDAFDPGVSPGRHWHEAQVEILGPNVLDWQSLFLETWERWSGEPLALPDVPAPEEQNPGFWGRLVVQSRAHAKSGIMRSFISHIRSSHERIWVATAYFVPPWKLRRALRRAAKRGVDVRLLLPGPRSDHPSVRHIGHRYYERLLRDGVRIFEYRPRFLHAKVLLCDQWASIGSCNLDRWNYRWNLEANQETRDPDFLAEVEQLFVSDMVHCDEFNYKSWCSRPRYRRLLEWFWGQIVLIVMRLTDRGGQAP